MSNQFKGKKLLVVGGTSGMGMQIARTVLADGGSVVIVGNRTEKTEEARKELAALGQVWALTADLTNDEAVASLIKTLDEQHSDIDLLVNAAACSSPSRSCSIRVRTTTSTCN
ncbi:short chain dehydrogenase family protein [Bordetella holmesii 30539]|uniref:KR domain protein n=2 Tax=Bordetella holmesii TaxID=35814 RepID=A0A158M1N5_9BORD|nr:short chain dehydrogenase family protein [Bordetella holmesii ATCC 51541]AIT28559.1 short chain dehydrogenase family protein [Bordetella holmesii 44057]EWM41347.1 short chain dehydrogenase family protein [Bordetella holmesii 35009]EWM42814.1 short chain dehydrogenase family protein [Bordetella holmesii 41130]EWM45243.1 short chain dehydrogenase family protein [Bordetella holmesii 70147]EXF88547.1 short chain dehydrogenase family protein [Bordetella holmesii 30539]EXX94549.1 short chain deh